MRETKNEILRIERLSKNFGGIRALTDFDISVEKGSIQCLIGPNGAGKTTVFKLIMGLYPPASGQIWFKGTEITRYPTARRVKSGIGIKMQVPGLYQNMTLRENLRIAIGGYKKGAEMWDEIDSLIELMGLKELGDPFAKNMTHGQQQWLEMAMALCTKPELLLLDEPAAGLGPEEAEFFAQIIERLVDDGMTILFIEHDMSFVRRVTQYVTVLHLGKKLTEGCMDEVSQNKEVIDVYLGKA